MNLTLKVEFHSSLATVMEQFVRTKKLQGYDYDSVIPKLKVFDRFLFENNFMGQRLDRETIENYIAQSRKAGLLPNSLYGRISIVSLFSRYLAQIDPGSAALERVPVTKVTHRRAHLYSREEILKLITAAGQLKPTAANPLRPHTYSTLIGLLYVSGLRIGEALALSDQDFDRGQNRLYVRQGKFGKDRWVPISQSTAEVIEHYVSRRRKVACASGEQVPLFIGPGHKALNQKIVGKTFRKLLEISQIKGSCQSRPHLHDLRHSFAVDRLRQAYEEGKELNAFLPVLATYMGHRTITGTQVYLHATEELRELANQRFHQYAQNQQIIPVTTQP